MFHLKLTINADCEHLQIDYRYAFCPPCTVFEGLFKVTSTWVRKTNNNNNNNNNKKYVLSNSECVQCNFFIFDHVTFIQFKIGWSVQNYFSLRYGDISIFKMAAVRHLGIVLPPYETTHEVCCWPQLPVKFHVNLIHRSGDIAIWIFRIWLEITSQAPKIVFGGTLGP